MLPLPAIKLYVSQSYISANQLSGLSEAYLLAADLRPASAIRFSVLLDVGAVWSGLPIEALWCDRFGSIDPSLPLSTYELQPFSCLEGPFSLISYELLKGAELATSLGDAAYLFTINYEGHGLAEDPEQHKTHNVCVLKSGQLAALPNNYIRVKTNWFGDEKADVSYLKRTTKHYFPGG